jgi:hypothetical protein
MLLSEFIGSLDRKLLGKWKFEADSKKGNIYSRVYSKDGNFICVKIVGNPIFGPLLENMVMAHIDLNSSKFTPDANAIVIKALESPRPFASFAFAKAGAASDL